MSLTQSRIMSGCWRWSIASCMILILFTFTLTICTFRWQHDIQCLR